MKIFYKKLVLSLLFCISLSVMSAQTMEIVHLKNGFDAKGTVVERNDSIVTLKTETGKTVTINAKDIESVEQEKPVFDPKVLVGRWACYDANGDRNGRYDMEICENEGYYTVRYNKVLLYRTNKDEPKLFPDNPDNVIIANKDLDIEKRIVSYQFYQTETCLMNANKKNKHVEIRFERTCDIELKYDDGKLKGTINCLHYYCAVGCYGFTSVEESLQNECGDVLANGPGEKWKVYFVKQ